MSPESFSLLVLAIGIFTVIGMIIVLRVNAFIALITAAMVVSVLAGAYFGGGWGNMIGRVAKAFGKNAGNIGIVIAAAAIIGKCMMDSGAADKVVRSFLNVMGEERASAALMGSGFVLSVPVFFDTVFYLLVPLARSLYTRTGKGYLKYLMAIVAGGAITHTLVPPTPGPLFMAANLNVDIGVMILVGAAIGIVPAVLGIFLASWWDKWMPVPMRKVGTEPEPEPLSDEQLPSLFWSLMPVVLPVLMISTNTVLNTLAKAERVAQLHVADVQDWGNLQRTLTVTPTGDQETPASRTLAVLSERSKPVVDKLKAGAPSTDEDKQALIAAFQLLQANKGFYQEEAFLGIKLSGTTKGLLNELKTTPERMDPINVERLNRLLLEESFPDLFVKHEWNTPMRKAADVSGLFGNPNLALLLAMAISMWVLYRQRKMSRQELANVVEIALMSGGVIILITAAGGAFGEMLGEAKVGDAIQTLSGGWLGGNGGMGILLLGFGVAVLLKIAQGSSTVAMIVTSGMIANLASPELLGFHPVYLATAIGGGSLVGSWMNDSGFWVYAKMGGLTEAEALKSWTIMLTILGLVTTALSALGAKLIPMV